MPFLPRYCSTFVSSFTSHWSHQLLKRVDTSYHVCFILSHKYLRYLGEGGPLSGKGNWGWVLSLEWCSRNYWHCPAALLQAVASTLLVMSLYRVLCVLNRNWVLCQSWSSVMPLSFFDLVLFFPRHFWYTHQRQLVLDILLSCCWRKANR